MDEGRDIYLRSILDNIPRALGYICRNRTMSAYGCFDRPFWNYCVTDTPCARYQEGVLILALLYTIKHEANPYYRNEEFLEWIKAGIEFWASIQSPGGAFNDLYPNEQSYVATAFSLYAVTETLIVLDKDITPGGNILMSIEKAAGWLSCSGHSPVMNQECGALAALHNSGLILNTGKYKAAEEKIIKDILAGQSGEGWLNEYGGPDIGYLSVSMDYLAKYWQKTKDGRILDAAKKAALFLANFSHPDLTFGGEYATRSTEYVLPHGVEILAGLDARLKNICVDIRGALESKTSITPYSLDEKYLIFNGYSYLQAYLDAAGEVRKDARQPGAYTYFEGAKIAIVNTGDIHMVINLAKGGALRLLFKKNLKVLADSGIALDIGRRNITSCYLNPGRDISSDGISFMSKGRMAYSPDNKLAPLKNIFFRFFQITAGRVPFISRFVKSLLRARAITGRSQTAFVSKREVKIYPDSVLITDTVYGAACPADVAVGQEIDTIYGESARFISGKTDKVPGVYLKKVMPRDGVICVERKFDLEGNCSINPC